MTVIFSRRLQCRFPVMTSQLFTPRLLIRCMKVFMADRGRTYNYWKIIVLLPAEQSKKG